MRDRLSRLTTLDTCTIMLLKNRVASTKIIWSIYVFFIGSFIFCTRFCYTMAPFPKLPSSSGWWPAMEENSIRLSISYGLHLLVHGNDAQGTRLAFALQCKPIDSTKKKHGNYLCTLEWLR